MHVNGDSDESLLVADRTRESLSNPHEAYVESAVPSGDQFSAAASADVSFLDQS